ncbi:hypothetical protein F5Y03DRAFT_185457 [Xylaria venustula]|nr:hypothetical protein F5Y03DRAFT_185457 [Xylaria venustula]
MANLPSQHPDLALHLTDRALTPLITSARANQRLDDLTALSHTALDAFESAQRLGLGIPQRIIVEHGEGPILLQTFLSPRPPPVNNHASPENSTSTTTSQLPPPPDSQARQPQHQGALALAVENRGSGSTSTLTPEAHLRGGAATPDAENHPIYRVENNPEIIVDEDEDPSNPDSSTPMLFGIVVAASTEDAFEARRAAARLERVGREIQGRWSELQGPSPARGSNGRPGESAGD